MQIKDLLKKGEIELKSENIEESNIKVKLLLSSLIGKNKEYLLIHDDEHIEQEIENKFFKKIERLKLGYPIQYITGKQEFYGIDFYVNESVLIPQPDTEILVEEVLNIINKNCNIKNILDLCTGNGAIAVSIKKNMNKKEIRVCASDISKEALEVAKLNADKQKTKIDFINSNLFEEINEKFDLIVSNPPYIKSEVIKSLTKEVQNEPIIALDGGEDGLDFYKKIVVNAKKFLNKNGIIALEIGYDQKEEVIQILKQNNYKEIYSKKDFGGNDRIVIAKV